VQRAQLCSIQAGEQSDNFRVCVDLQLRTHPYLESGGPPVTAPRCSIATRNGRAFTGESPPAGAHRTYSISGSAPVRAAGASRARLPKDLSRGYVCRCLLR
jgi:hypothetical protein